MLDLALALVAGLGAGILNAVVGAGTLVTYTVLLALGLNPLAANVTSAAGIFPGSIAGAYTYRTVLREAQLRTELVLATIAMVVGSLLGIPLLLLLPPEVFSRIVPWLILLAGALTILQPWLRGRPVFGVRAVKPRRIVLVLGICAAGIYLSYFGAATGVITLTVLLIVGIQDLQLANGIKNLITGVANCLIGVLFLFIAPVNIPFALAIAIGSTLGGLVGGRAAQRLSPVVFRFVIGLVAILAAVATFLA